MICVSCSKDLREPYIHTCWNAGKLHLVRVVAPNFVCGLVFEGTRCIEAAPIMRWVRGKEWRDIALWCRSKRFEFEVRRIS